MPHRFGLMSLPGARHPRRFRSVRPLCSLQRTITPMPTQQSETDLPISFGYKCAWYALCTNDPDAVISALGIVRPSVSNWEAGIDAAYGEKVFVTPPLGEWILAAGTPLFHSDRSAETSVAPMLARLSKVFGEVQYFATQRVVEAHCWALARNGTILRAFEFVGDHGEISWSVGEPTEAERLLGEEALQFPGPNEDDVMKVAGAWSIDPSDLESHFTEPSLGRVGALR